MQMSIRFLPRVSYLMIQVLMIPIHNIHTEQQISNYKEDTTMLSLVLCDAHTNNQHRVKTKITRPCFDTLS